MRIIEVGISLHTRDSRSGKMIENKGRQMYQLAEELFPLCRSITGNGVRETLKILNNIHPLEIKEVPSGTEVFDWTVPEEWNIRYLNEQIDKAIQIIINHKDGKFADFSSLIDPNF